MENKNEPRKIQLFNRDDHAHEIRAWKRRDRNQEICDAINAFLIGALTMIVIYLLVGIS